MTDRQTALLLRSVRTRVYGVRDNLAFWAADNPEATGAEVLERAQNLLYANLQSELDDDIDRLEAPHV